MPLFRCSKCGCVENTALSNFWRTESDAHAAGTEHKPLCSECDPNIGRWHGQFEKKSADGYRPDGRGQFIRAPGAKT